MNYCNKNDWETNFIGGYGMVYSQHTQWNERPFSFSTIEWGNSITTKFRKNKAEKFRLYCG
ncbi:19933_t:CDS:1, partial [Entrophospora sp. SA101]